MQMERAVRWHLPRFFPKSIYTSRCECIILNVHEDLHFICSNSINSSDKLLIFSGLFLSYLWRFLFVHIINPRSDHANSQTYGKPVIDQTRQFSKIFSFFFKVKGCRLLNTTFLCGY